LIQLKPKNCFAGSIDEFSQFLKDEEIDKTLKEQKYKTEVGNWGFKDSTPFRGNLKRGENGRRRIFL